MSLLWCNGTVRKVKCVDSRYFVYRRSALDPLFHPYYLDYGGDKQDIYYRLRAMKCTIWFGAFIIDNTPYVLPTEFGFDIPHPRSPLSVHYIRTAKEQPMYRQYYSFISLSRKWIR